MRCLAVGFAVMAMCASSVVAQTTPPGLPTPRIQNIFPMGAKVGTAVEITVNGSDLEEPTGLMFSHPGLKAEYLTPSEPTKPDPKKPAKAKNTPAGSHQFRVTVGTDVPFGNHDIRFVGKWGVSNPRAFVVGDLVEVNEKEPNNDVPEAQRVEIGTTIKGVVANPTDVDYSVFTGKKGQRVIVSCLASSIDSRSHPMIEVYDTTGRKLASNRNNRDSDAMADVILPADGDYLVRVCEFTYTTGSVDHVYRLTISTAPWIDAVFPPAIEPGKPAQVTLYGRNLPGGQPADGMTVEGRSLEKLTVTIDPPAQAGAETRLTARDRIEPGCAPQDGFEYRLKGSGGLGNAVVIYFAHDKVVLKKNTGGTKADGVESVTTPCEVAGMLHRRGDRDWYAFEAKKGDRLSIELIAERNATAADFYFSVFNPANKMQDLSGEIDDDPDLLHPNGFYNRTGDPPVYKFTAPADGKYLVAVGCRESSYLFGPRTIYRLRLSEAKPDFRAIVMPYSRFFQTGSAGRQGGTEAYDLFLHRIDGFAGPVTFEAIGLPKGVTAKPTVIGSAARWGTLVLNIDGSAPSWTGAFTVKATATISDKPATREARPATVTWGFPQKDQNVPVIARLDQSLVLAVRPEKAFFRIDIDTDKVMLKGMKEEKLPTPITIKQGEKITFPVKVEWLTAEKPNVTLNPELVTQQNQQNLIYTLVVGTQPTKEKPETTITVDFKPTTLPGTYSIVLRGESLIPFIKDAMNKPKGNTVPSLEFSTPIQITVIPTLVAKVTAEQAANTVVKIGGTGEVIVRVDRQYDYAGEFKVKLLPAPGMTGFTAEEVTIPAGKNETKMVVKAPADAKAGRVNANVQVVAVYGGKHTIVQEGKLGFNVGK